MKTNRLALVAALVGAIALAPAELLTAQAATTATSSSSTTNVSTSQFGAVAGSSPAATAAAAYSVPGFTTSCTVSNSTSGSNNFPKTTLGMSTVTGYVVGMQPIATGIPSGARIVSIKTSSPRNIVISIATTANISNGTSILGAGCWQQYFSVNNIQATALNSYGVQQIFSSVSPDTVTMQRCSGTWTESTGACSGAITTVVTGSATSAITTVPVALAASTGTSRLRLAASKSGISVTISVSIRRATDVPAGVESQS